MTYRHTQFGRVMALALGGMIAVVIAVAITPRLFHPVALAALALLAIVLLTMITLTVEIRDGALRCWFGPGLIRRTIPLADIDGATVVEYSWLTGYGIRWLPGRYVLWNVSGTRAVELTLAGGKRFRIGTDEPEELVRAIERAIRSRRQSAPRDRQA